MSRYRSDKTAFPMLNGQAPSLTESEKCLIQKIAGEVL